MIKDRIQDNSILLTQDWNDNDSPEESLLLEPYTNCFTITQEDKTLHINYHSIKELKKCLTIIEQNRPK